MWQSRLVFQPLYTMLRALVADERPRAYGHRFLLRRVRARILTHSHLQEAILNGGSSSAISEVSPEVSRLFQRRGAS